jgi:hypothetical protein
MMAGAFQLTYGKYTTPVSAEIHPNRDGRGAFYWWLSALPVCCMLASHDHVRVLWWCR